jgi:hypothetical protein
MTGELYDYSDLTQERIAQNQATIRASNETIEATAESIGVGGAIPFICECADPRCTEIVRLTMVEYENIRAIGRRFFTAPGHHRLAVDAGAAIVVAERDGFVVVDKIGVAAEIAEERHGEQARLDNDA